MKSSLLTLRIRRFHKEKDPQQWLETFQVEIITHQLLVIRVPVQVPVQVPVPVLAPVTARVVAGVPA